MKEEDMTLDLFVVAEKYAVDLVRKKCAQVLSKHLNVENAIPARRGTPSLRKTIVSGCSSFHVEKW